MRVKSAAAISWLISAVLFAAGFALAGRPVETPAQACGMPPNPPVRMDAIEITIMAKADHRDCWQVQMAVAAAPLVTGYTLGIRTLPLLMNDDPAVEARTAAVTLGRAADILQITDGELKDFANMGMLAPLDACVSAHAEFANVRQDAWLAATVRGQVWGVPVAADTDTLFFSKTLLRRMGWSEARIGDLPQQILEGAFTRDDMRRTAEDAVRRGIVRPGFGVWEDQDRAWDVKTPRRDARISARVLFWYWNNRAWGEDLLKLGGPDKFEWLYNNMGYALPPADKADAKPASLRAASYKVFYVITADKANGNRGHQKEACALLAKMTTPEINDRHIAHGGYLSVMTPKAQTLPEARFGYDIMRMIDGTYGQRK